MKKKDETKGFKVPKDYFETLDSKLTHRVSEEHRHGFKTPEDYFDNFEVEVPLEESKKRIFKLDRPTIGKVVWMAAAASILLFFGLNNLNQDQPGLEWEDLDNAEISFWIENDLSELNAYDIAEAYPDVELDETPFSNDELNAYLNDIELDQILYEN
jgi:hypothetical protein